MTYGAADNKKEKEGREKYRERDISKGRVADICLLSYTQWDLLPKDNNDPAASPVVSRGDGGTFLGRLWSSWRIARGKVVPRVPHSAHGVHVMVDTVEIPEIWTDFIRSFR